MCVCGEGGGEGETHGSKARIRTFRHAAVPDGATQTVTEGKIEATTSSVASIIDATFVSLEVEDEALELCTD